MASNIETSTLTVQKYTAHHKRSWDDFVSASKNGTFLFNRDFMEYHSDRFDDHSILVLDEKEQIIGVLPANEKEKTIYSHGGLTYGGIVLGKDIKLQKVIQVFHIILSYYHEKGYETIIYKSVPSFYHQTPAFEEQYLMFLLEAKNIRVDTSFTLDLRSKYKYQKRRERSIKKAAKKEIELQNNRGFQSFWEQILTPNLMERFKVKPVHSLEEIELLNSRFPENIQQYNILLGGELVAGTTVFKTQNVAHAQYISANIEGRRSGALDYLFDHLIKNVFKDLDYFSFGISNEQGGKVLNIGLMDWKEGFDGRVYPNHFYEIKTQNFNNLEPFL